ncbi:GlyGly-CTERM sorting domain-containing protein [Arsukibacterium perlucidum]|uniref:GlyGly-CTERM sorting domain-containing protein n=1 Tax=Arsukibacterium perlucidum TaxID=368811 RepID=UPI0003655554|nr:GlyGly-CTERM sorting domain-containing protein [Arsukibacterium perlucidum]
MLKSREQYISLNDYDDRYYCNRGQVFKDALTDAYLKHGFLPQDFDINANNRDHNELLLNGAVLLYEGGPGLCSGTNLSSVDGISYFPPGVIAEQAMLQPFALESLARDDEPHTAILASINANLRVYNNMPETDVSPDVLYSWTHELGHLLLGFPDYYYEKCNMGYFALSAQPAETHLATHPAAFEKWLFAKWFSPKEAQQNNTYTLTSHDIADGADYQADTAYLHKHLINGAEGHFLLIENRWFDNAGNTHSVWATTSQSEYSILQSGLQIVEVNLANSTFSDEPQIKRFSKASQFPEQATAAWQQGDTFYQCFANSYCIRIDNITAAGEQVSYRLSATVDSDQDGMPDDWEVQFSLNPLDASDASSDKDNDGFTALQEYQNGTNPNVSNKTTAEPAPQASSGGTMPYSALLLLAILAIRRQQKM